MLFSRVSLAFVTGVTMYGVEVDRGFFLVVIKILRVNVNGHPHHFAGVFLHFIFIGHEVEAVFKARNRVVTETASHTERAGIGSHDTVHIVFADILWKDLQVFVPGIRWSRRSHSQYYQGGEDQQGDIDTGGKHLF